MSKVKSEEDKKISQQLSSFYVLAVDVETSGSSYTKNGILSIGASLYGQDCIEKEAFQVNILLPEGRSYEQACKENFWDKFPEAQKFIETNALHPTEAMRLFSDFLLKVENQYKNITIISDNPSFDIAWIDCYLDLYTNRKPLRYSSLDGGYKMVWDSTSIQKSWLCLKTPESSFYSPPKGHREKLDLPFSYPHDHNPLNDARNVAIFYIQTLEQMKQFRETIPKAPLPRAITLSKYDQKWKEYFISEKHSIQLAFEESNVTENLLQVHHVGSTSVEGLIAKPIVDIIVVVKNFNLIDDALSKAGYRYKGEYNIPMRRMYGKNIGYEVYVHVYEEGNPEIKLNLMFRDYLKEDKAAREEYSALKQAIVEKNNAHSKVSSTGITTYNLEKNGFIENILIKAGFKELCMRLCTQNTEWESYNLIRKTVKINKSHDVKNEDPYQKHLILYKGTKIIGAAQIQLSIPNAFLVFLEFDGMVVESEADLELYKDYFLSKIEQWIKKKGVVCFTASATTNQLPFYQSKSYKIIGSENHQTYIIKDFINPTPHEIEPPIMSPSTLIGKVINNFYSK